MPGGGLRRASASAKSDLLQQKLAIKRERLRQEEEIRISASLAEDFLTDGLEEMYNEGGKRVTKPRPPSEPPSQRPSERIRKSKAAANAVQPPSPDLGADQREARIVELEVEQKKRIVELEVEQKKRVARNEQLETALAERDERLKEVQRPFRISFYHRAHKARLLMPALG